jgi:phospholipid/cholesterol/gamma-HCH transport system substrate-binding protein
MSERARNLTVGITALLGVVGVVVMMMLFGYAPRWFEEGYAVTVVMNSAGGLAKGSRVLMAGKGVGRVDSVELTGPPQWGVLVVAIVEAGVRLPGEVKISVQSPILGGSPALTLQPRPQASQIPITYLPADGTARIEVDHVPSLLSEFAAELQSALNASVTDLRNELGKAQANLDALTKTWVTVGSNLNELIRPRSPQTVDSDPTGKTRGNVATLVARADARLRQIEIVIEDMKKWVGDHELRSRIRSAAATAEKFVKTADGGVDRVVAVVENAGASFDGLSKKYTEVADELAQAIQSLRQVIALAGSGQGTLGKALKDPAVFDNVNDAFSRLSLALDEMRMLLEKWLTEGLPVRF